MSDRGGAIGAPPHWLCTSIAISEKSQELLGHGNVEASRVNLPLLLPSVSS